MSVFDKGSWRVVVQRGPEAWDPLGEQTRLFIMWRTPDGGKKIVKAFELEDLPEMTASTTHPSYVEDGGDHEDLVRAILNAAWEAGLRPDGFEDAKRETETLKSWLKDMRHLAFKGNAP